VIEEYVDTIQPRHAEDLPPTNGSSWEAEEEEENGSMTNNNRASVRGKSGSCCNISHRNDGNNEVLGHIGGMEGEGGGDGEGGQQQDLEEEEELGRVPSDIRDSVSLALEYDQEQLPSFMVVSGLWDRESGMLRESELKRIEDDIAAEQVS
jgi:hypothetical protein